MEPAQTEDATGQIRVENNEPPDEALTLCPLNKGKGVEKLPAFCTEHAFSSDEKQDGSSVTLPTTHIDPPALVASLHGERIEPSHQAGKGSIKFTSERTDITDVESCIPSGDGRSSPATLPVEEIEQPATGECDGGDSTPKPRTCGPYRKYLVVVGSFFSNAILEGSFNAFGVLYTDIWKHFGGSKSSVALVGSLFVSLPLIGGAMASLVTVKLGCRTAAMVGGVVTALGILASVFVQSLGLMYLTFGCIAGIGASLPYLSASVILGQNFRSKLGLASGISECGGGMGTVFMPMVFETLLVTYGWRGTLMILSAIVLNVCVCGALYQSISPPKTEKNRLKKEKFEQFVGESTYPRENISPYILQSYYNGSVVTTDKEKNFDFTQGDCLKEITKACSSKFSLHIFTNSEYILYTFAVFFFNLWVGVPYVYLSDKAIEHGVDKENASLLLSIIGASQLVGCLTAGAVVDNRKIDKITMFGVTSALSGTALALMPRFSTFAPLAVLAAVFGLFSAPVDSMSLVMLTDILDSKQLSSGFGYIMTLKGFGELLGPPIAGLLYDGSGNYDNTFYAAGGSMIACGVLYRLLSKVKVGRCTHLSPRVAADAPEVFLK
ncbi:monocarboxylate transporter 12-like [Haliotis rubra]|uniref:monocarboxylate transporter 12-like n=1 Tax=Haliotis rubra TaxID=36100 RepID=UPI001EE555BD|nr:monocarboxylate transporter 12-like [Haliotis rubra]